MTPQQRIIDLSFFTIHVHALSQATVHGYPISIFFIVINEFCERFSYYGMRGEIYKTFIQLCQSYEYIYSSYCMWKD